MLRALRGDDLYIRCRDLYEAGWTLRAISEAFTPPVARSTVHSWISKTEWAPTLPIHPLPALPIPTLKTEAMYKPTRTPSPGITQTDRDRIAELAPQARKFRARQGPNHPSYLANKELTTLCRALFRTGVTTQELADAAGVTYRAMAKRLGRAS